MAEQTTPRLGLDKYTSGNDPHPNRAKFNASRDLMEQLIAIAEQGTIAARPPAGRGGALYCVTDQNNRLYFDQGTQWVEVSPVGGVTPKSIVLTGSSSEGTSHRAARADHTHVLHEVTLRNTAFKPRDSVFASYPNPEAVTNSSGYASYVVHSGNKSTAYFVKTVQFATTPPPPPSSFTFILQERTVLEVQDGALTSPAVYVRWGVKFSPTEYQWTNWSPIMSPVN